LFIGFGAKGVHKLQIDVLAKIPAVQRFTTTLYPSGSNPTVHCQWVDLLLCDVIPSADDTLMCQRLLQCLALPVHFLPSSLTDISGSLAASELELYFWQGVLAETKPGSSAADVYL
jgi:hypothetical protein